ncbi:MAG TPA: FixH family protein [Xanthobacteraceae bacterium]
MGHAFRSSPIPSGAVGTRLRPAARRPRELTGRMVLVWLLAFFAVVAGANAVMIKLAVSSFGGVDIDNAYRAGLAFTREIAAVEAQDARRWQVTAGVAPEAGATRIEVTARDAAARPLAGLAATARLTHPTDRRLDRVVPLREEAPGQYRGTTAPAAGQWTLDIELLREGTALFRSRNRVFLR